MNVESSKKSNKLIVLDLDETLLHASETSIGREADCVIGRYYTYIRPHCAQFLKFCLCSFESVGVWTSSSNAYAQEAVNLLFGNDQSKLKFVWARERCTQKHSRIDYKTIWIKDLGKLKRRGFELEKIIMIDDTPEKLQRQYGNLIRVEPFFGDPEDEELLALQNYLGYLSTVENIRVVEKRGWKSHTKAWEACDSQTGKN